MSSRQLACKRGLGIEKAPLLGYFRAFLYECSWITVWSRNANEVTNTQILLHDLELFDNFC